ncbi:MAG TPA: hypothetical protein VHS59_06650 [Bacillota bacterium]|nr:hypothetical protein [Bacillota bacterium]
MKRTILVTLLATALAVAPTQLPFALADEQPAATTQDTVYATTTTQDSVYGTTTQDTVYGSTYTPAPVITPAPAKKETVKNAAYKRGDVQALKALIAKLVVNPKDAAVKAEILKLAPSKQYIPVVARAINLVKADINKEMKAAGENKALRQQAQKKIRVLNQISKDLKQAIIKYEKQAKIAAAKAKLAADKAKLAAAKAKLAADKAKLAAAKAKKAAAPATAPTTKSTGAKAVKAKK